MPGRLPPKVSIEVISHSSGNIDQKLNALYIRIVRRQLLESRFNCEQRADAIKALGKVRREQAKKYK